MLKTSFENKTHRPGLKPALVAVILVCWAIPMLLVVWLGGNYIVENQRSQARRDILQSTTNAVNLARRNLDSAIGASRKASYISTIGDAWAEYCKNGRRAELYSEVSAFLNNQYKYDDTFRSTFVTFVDEPSTSVYTYASNASYASVRRYQKLVQSKVLAGSEALGTGLRFLAAEGSLYMARNLLDNNYHPYAVLVMELNDETLFGSLYNVLWADSASIWVGGAPLILMGDEAQTPQVEPGSAAQYSAAGVIATVYGSEKLTAGGTLDYTFSYDLQSLRSQVRGMLLTLTLLTLILIPLIGAVIWFLEQMVNLPIAALGDASDRIAKGEFGTRVTAQHLRSREFYALGNNFNTMSDKLKNQFEHIYKEELALRDARIMALQSQINPHFLNNTLEIINWEARLAGDIKVTQMLEALSTMLEAAMDRRHSPLVHLSEELMYVDAYLFIIRERLGKRLTVEKQIAPDTLDEYVPRLILQPVLENAIEHGINPIQKGTITLRARREPGRLVLEIENDGVTTYDDLMKIEKLLGDEPLPEGTGSSSLGIRNVHQRLRMLYGEKSGLSITITETGTTLSKISIELEQSGQ